MMDSMVENKRDGFYTMSKTKFQGFSKNFQDFLRILKYVLLQIQSSQNFKIFVATNSIIFFLLYSL